jgi:hypothetical protein
MGVNMLNLHKKVSLRLDPELSERLHLYASRERVPVSHVLRHLVLRFLSESPKVGGQASPALRGVSAPAVSDLHKEFTEKVCSLFDDFRRQGYDAKESAKRVNFALKAKKHPWATYEVIAGIIRSTGRFRKGVNP